MRELLIERIIHLLKCNGGGNPKEEMDLNNGRFIGVFQRFIEMLNNDPNWKHPKRYEGKLWVTDVDLALLTDQQLVELFEYVVQRAYVCR